MTKKNPNFTGQDIQIQYRVRNQTQIKTPNAPRTPPPGWFKSQESLEFSDSYIAVQDDITVCQNLAGIASKVLRRPIKIFMRTEIEGVTFAFTDGKDIYIPKNHPQRRIATKHELAHLYFESDIPLRLLFVQDLIQSLQDKVRVDEGTRSELVNDLCFLINIFDDIRVNSLWGLLYPGDGRDLDGWYYGDVAPRMEAAALEQFGEDVSKLSVYVILTSLGRNVPSTKWGKFKEKIQKAADDVNFKTFSACLLICKNLLLEICEEYLKDLEEQRKKEANASGEEASKSTGKEETVIELLKSETQIPTPANLVDHNAGFDFQNYVEPPKSKEYKAALKHLNDLQKKPIEDVLGEEEEAAIEALQEIQESLDNVAAQPPPEHEYFSEGVQGKVVRVPFADACSPATVTPAWITETGKQWNLFFRNIACVTKNKEEEFGAELVPELYIQKRLQREPLDVFRNSSTGIGFRATILLDLSGSMKSALPYVQATLSLLQKAFDFPQAKINVLGFNSTMPGVTTIYEYERGSLAGLVINNRGLTPLPQAIRYAGNALSGHQDHSHLLVLSDGYPRFFTKEGRAVHLKALMGWTKEAVRDITAHKVNIHCIMLGEDVSDADLEWMFGSRWTRAIIPSHIGNRHLMSQPNLLTTSIFEFLRAQFIRYLKVR